MNEEYIISAREEFGTDNIKHLLAKIEQTQYDFTKPVPPKPEYNLFIDDRGIALPGSLISVYGLPKSRKSIFLAMIVASILNKNGEYGDGLFKSKLKKGRVIWFDTEQSEIELKYFQDNIMKMAGLGKDDYNYIQKRYNAFHLRPFDELDRLVLIDEILLYSKYKDISCVVIDGIADLMYNVNDIEASKKLVTRLMYWADTLKIPIFTALHTNKDGEDATGSLGGFLNKKASYTIKTKMAFADSPTEVTPYYIRNGEFFPSFQIKNDENGVPFVFQNTDTFVPTSKLLEEENPEKEEEKFEEKEEQEFLEKELEKDDEEENNSIYEEINF